MAVALAAATSCIADIASAPPSAELERLRKQSRHSVAVVWSGGRKFELPKLRLDSTGVWSADKGIYRLPRLAIVETPSAVHFDPPPKPVAWSTIDSIAVTARGPGMGTLFLGTTVLALVVGLPIAGVVIANATHTAGGGTPSTAAVLLPLAVAGVLGATLIHHHDKVSVIYRRK